MFFRASLEYIWIEWGYDLLIVAWIGALGLWVVSLWLPSVADLSRYGKFAASSSSSIMWTIGRAEGFKWMYLLASLWCLLLVAVRRLSLHLFLVTLHVMQRAAECIWTHRGSKATMTVPGWLLGMGFYGAVPLNDAFVRVSFDEWWWLLLLSLLFCLCCYRQHWCHTVLAQLRSTPNSEQYGIPPAIGEFRFTWSPHYAYECILYILLSASCGWALPSLMCSLFVMVNQTQLMLQTAAWYRQRL